MLLSRFKVVGHSMNPTFRDNDYVLVSSFPYLFLSPAVGDVVLFENQGQLFVKRINKMEGSKFFLVGDNLEDSLDSRKIGTIERNKIKGKVIMKI